jgi:hypothetical protein
MDPHEGSDKVSYMSISYKWYHQLHVFPAFDNDYYLYITKVRNRRMQQRYIEPKSEQERRSFFVIIAYLRKEPNCAITTRGSYMFTMKNNTNVGPPEATGTAASIHGWATFASMTDRQIQAFGCIVSSYVLTYCNFSGAGNSCMNTNVGQYEKKAVPSETMNLFLQDLARLCVGQLEMEGEPAENLTLLLYGARGSGKSYVIATAVEYITEFVRLMNRPYSPTTVLVRGMIGGEGTFFGESGTEHVVEELSKTNLLIIEVSQVEGKVDCCLMDRKMRQVMDNQYKDYTGCNIVVCGDFSGGEPVKHGGLDLNGKPRAYAGFFNAFIEMK